MTVTVTDTGRIQLTDQQVADYQANGFLVAEGALGGEELEQLKQDTVKICRGDYGDFKGWEGPHDDLTDDQVMHRYLCIHFPHKVSQTMLRYVTHQAHADVLSRVIGPNVKCMQSMLFIKAAGKPGQAWHQDEYYIPTRDRSLTGGWIAIDDATVENGCLWVIPGSHKHGIIWPQHQHDDSRFDCTGEAHRYPYTDDDAIPVEVKAGSIVFFNGYLLHRSLPNRAKGGYRRVLVNHYMSAESLLPWGRIPEGAGVANADFRDIVMICGDDPYAWKGVEDLSRPHVRASGEGGCGKRGDATDKQETDDAYA